MVDAEVASVSAAGDRGEALAAICRTFGLHQFRRSEPDVPAAEDDRAVLWLSSERCLIGVRRKHADPMPFVALVRPRSNQEFAPWQRDVARIGLLYESGRLEWSRSSAADDTGGAIDEIMSRLDIACALVDAGRHVIYANRAAGAWLRGQGALRVADGRLSAVGSDRQRQFAAAVQAATLGDPRRAQALVIRDEDHGSPAMVVSCLPLPGEDPRALVVFGNHARSGEPADLLLGAFGLTSAERRIACRLLAGRTLEEAAEEACIRISTARGYLKAIFAKTGVRRQGEFVAVIGALVPPVSLPQFAPPQRLPKPAA